MALAPDAILEAHLPPGFERDELVRLVRVGAKFAEQHRGRRPGFLRRYVGELVRRLETRTFAALLVELELDAVRRDVRGERASPIERVDRSFEVLTYHDPKHGRRQVTFKRIRNIAKLRSDPAIR